jgi:outer membrane protein
MPLDEKRIEPLSVPSNAQIDGTKRAIKLDAQYTKFVTAKAPLTIVTLKEAVRFAETNYPSIIRAIADVEAAKQNIKVQKLNEYVPNSLLQYQQLMATHNQFSGTYFSSPAFPSVTGPSFNNVNMNPFFSTLGGASLDWAPIDAGLHKARIDLTRLRYLQNKEGLGITQLDVANSAANAFLDVAVSLEQVKAANENVNTFMKFKDVVDAQISGNLKPGADGYLAGAQLANARNDLIRANLAYEVAIARLSSSMGVGGQQVTVDTEGLATVDEPHYELRNTLDATQNPLLRQARVSLLSAIQEKKVISKEYFPTLHFIGGVNVRGSGLSTETGLKDYGRSAAGTVPTKPNYQVGAVINWNFLDFFRLNAEKQVQVERIKREQQSYALILQNLRALSVETRAKVRAAVALAENMPVQVESANIALRLAEARYQTGLGSVAQVAEAAQSLANSRVKQASARIGVWRAILESAYVSGNIKPFVAAADSVQRKF